MDFRINSLFGLSMFLFVICLANGAHATETGFIKNKKYLNNKIQNFLMETTSSTPNIYEMSLHAMLDSGDTVRIACTNLEKLGTPSDPEDVEAIIANKVIFIHEGEVYDITVPLVNKQGQPFAVTGLKVEHKGKISQAEAKDIAIKLAKKVEAMVQSIQ